MPLQLNTPTHALPKRVVWDPTNETESAEAKEVIFDHLAKGFKLLEDNPGETLLVPPDGEPGQVVMRVLDETGDTRVVWDRHKDAEVKEAREKFIELLGKGYKGYVCRSDGSKGRRVETFDALLEEIIMLEKQAATSAPRGAKEKPAEVVMVPATAPG